MLNSLFLIRNFNQRKYDSIPKKVECKIHSDLVANFTCSYKPTGWKRAVYNFDGVIAPNVQLFDLIVMNNC